MRHTIYSFILLLAAAGTLIGLRFFNDARQHPSPLAVYPEPGQKSPRVRILIRTKIKEAEVKVTGKYELLTLASTGEEQRIGGGSHAVTVTIKPGQKGIHLGSPLAPHDLIAIRPLSGCQILVDQINYGGEVAFYRHTPTDRNQPVTLRLLVLLDLEQYLIGVVPAEMPASWPVAALQAQTIASRSYALYKIKTRAHLPFDVRATTASQVWRPALQKNPIINMAINSTRGLVLTDQYRLFPAYFSSRCGGITKDGVNVFVSRHIAPLSGVRCPYCQSQKGAERGAWQFSMIVEELERRLRDQGYSIGRITRIRSMDAEHRTFSGLGRVYDVAIEHTLDGKSKASEISLSAQHFRRIVGGGKRQLASTYFSMAIEEGEIRFEGRGFGHGVGFCQYGSRHLALQEKYDFRDILNHYYHGHTLARLW
ncbi:MAG: SpoIID/LytB domain-containing protein [Planctomycetota bacterium]|jgi:stage II sporulation protein D